MAPNPNSLTKRFESRRASNVFVAASLSVLVLMASLAFVYGAPASNALLNLLDGKAWFSDDENGVVMLANGASGVVDTRVKVPGGENGDLRVIRVGNHWIVINDRTGQVNRLDLANLQVSAPQQIAGNGLDVVAMGNRMLVVNKAKGEVEIFNPASLSPISKLSLGGSLTRAIVDSDGVAWVADARAGQLISVSFNEQTNKLVRGSVRVDPGEQFELATVGGDPVVIDLGAQTMVRVKDRTPARPVAIPLRADEQPAVPRSVEGGVLPIAANSAGAVVMAKTQEPTRTDLGRSGNEFGPPVVFSERIYLPDLTTGELLVLDPEGNVVGSPKKVGNGPFSVRVEEGFLWVDDPRGEGALVAGPDHGFREVDKGREVAADNEVAPAPIEPPRPIESTRVQPPAPERPPGVGGGTEPDDGVPAPPPPPVEPQVAPDAPASVTAAAGNRTALVSWTAPRNVPPPLEYRVQWTNAGRTSHKVVRNGLEVTVDSLTNGTAYTFDVSAINSVGEGPAARSQSVTPSADVPLAPTGVTARANAAGAVNISWTAADGQGRAIAGYVVSASEGAGGSKHQIAGDVAETSYRVVPASGALQLGKSYTFTVVAKNVSGNVSPESAPSAAVLVSKAADAPSGLAATTPSSGTVHLSWTAPALNGGTPVDYVVTGSNGVQSKNVTGTSTSFTGLSNGVAYTFEVAARTSANGSTMTGASAGVSATPGTAPGVSMSANASGDRNINWSYNFNANGSGAATCTVFRSGTPISGPAPCQASASGSTGGLAYNTTYELFVRAENPYGTTDSNRVSPRTNIAPPPPSAPPPAPSTWTQKVGQYGSGTFTNYRNASGVGPRIQPFGTVQVSCKVHDPTITSNTEGWWYRVASAPWNNGYYAPASTFYNGDETPPYTKNVDHAVRNC